jgi:hypothetical protein
MRAALDDDLTAECVRCAADPSRFNDVILGRGPYWSRQQELCRSVVKYRETVAVTGNGVGKTYLLAGLAWWALASHPGCKVVLSAPTLGQLRGAVWGEIGAAYRSAHDRGMPLGARVRTLEAEYDDEWRMECFGSGSVESKSGRHAEHLFALIDENSGTPHQVEEAIASLNPSRIVRFGNPIRPDGKFYERAELSGDNPHVNVVRIPSTESPDADCVRSPRGMADKTWLEASAAEWGIESQWWLSHVLARFPGSTVDTLLPGPWLDQAGLIIHLAHGDRWMGVDIGEGGGGDESLIVVRDDNGLLHTEGSNRWDMETLAERVRQACERFEVHPAHVVYDANGIGADFDSRLRAVGLHGCKPFKGSQGGNGKFLNLRAACGWAVRRRIDPKFPVRQRGPNGRAIYEVQKPFAIPKAILLKYRAELAGLQYHTTPTGLTALELKEDYVKRLKRSPNFFDAWSMTYAYPHA